MTWQTLNQQLTFMRRSKRPTPSRGASSARRERAALFDNYMKRRLILIVQPEALLKMPTKQLLGRLQALHRCEESAVF